MSNPTPPPDSGLPPGHGVPPPSVPVPRPVVVQSLTPNIASSAIPVAPISHASGYVPVPPPVGIAVEEEQYAYAPEQQGHYVAPPPKKKNFFMEQWRKIGAGSLGISILVHAVIIGIAIAWVSSQMIYPKVDFLPGGGSKGAADSSAQVQQQVQSKKRSSISKTSPMRKVVSQSTTSNISLPDVPVDSLNVPEVSSLMGGAAGSAGFGSAGAGGGFGKGTGIGSQAGFTSLPPTLKARCNATERLTKLKESGGTPECEKAVSNALAYFKTKQKPDGSWGTQNKGAMTGLALLCYLGRCETPDSNFYGDNVMKGILYLVELSKKNPEGIMCQEMKGNAVPYEHGIATYAMGEMYSLARMGGKALPGMREAFEQGVKTIIKYQHADGSWVYDAMGGNYAANGREDLSVTGWQYQALKAAKLSGLKFDNLHTAIDKVVKYIEKKQTKDGGIGNAQREGGYNQWDLTGTGVLGLQTLGHGKSTIIKKGIKFAYDYFQKEPPDWKEAKLYDWYYYAQAFFQNGGAEWKYWNETALPLLLSNQLPDGSWKTNGKGTGAGAGGDNIYPTAQCTLMLEVYYRYLKVGDREEGSIFAR